MTAISVVVETWNLGGAPSQALARLLESLAPQVAASDAEVVITHCGIPAGSRGALDGALGAKATWVELAKAAGYYEHKHAGFDASTGAVVAFIDGDCAPSPGWLDSLIAPIRGDGATVVAGLTSYSGPLAPLASMIDFPYFDGERVWQPGSPPPRHVRNFFANNVAFERQVFAARRYPTIEPMFHGQCQVLGLKLLRDGIAIRFAPTARVIHAWPENLNDWLEVRLLRGADGVSLLPYIVDAYRPAMNGVLSRLGSLPALALLGYRAMLAARAAVRHGPAVRGLRFVAGVTLLDAIGAASAQVVYRFLPRARGEAGQ